MSKNMAEPEAAGKIAHARCMLGKATREKAQRPLPCIYIYTRARTRAHTQEYVIHIAFPLSSGFVNAPVFGYT